MNWSTELDDIQLRMSHNNSSSHKLQEFFPPHAQRSQSREQEAFQAESKIMKCPECGARVYAYYLNPQEKIFMCRRSKCNYPFDQKNLIYNLARKHEEEVVGRLLSKRIDGEYKCPSRI